MNSGGCVEIWGQAGITQISMHPEKAKSPKQAPGIIRIVSS
jgi:hypothetical protein